MAQPVETLFVDRELQMRWLPGRTRRMVVVFTGMRGGIGGQDLAEFAGSASDGGDNNVLFVSDRRATWYAAPGLWRRIVRMIKTVRASEAISEVVTLGNSMGGYGALLLPRDVRVSRAVAFSPQVTMDRSLLADDRWPDVQARYGKLPVGNVGETVDGTRTQYHVIAGTGCPPDMAHLDLIPDHRRVHRYALPDGRHNLAASLKEGGLLRPLVRAILRGRRIQVERMLAGFGAVA